MTIYTNPTQIVEIDMDYCALEFGVGTCTAALGSAVPNKCHNTYHTCPVKSLFDKGTLTLKFTKSMSNMPVDQGLYYPVLQSVSALANTVNLSGSDPKLGLLGRRGTVEVNLRDFVYNDTYVDKYSSERVSGTAQNSGVGYDPLDQGTFFSKTKARFPNYAGRAIRVIDGYLQPDGTITEQTERHYILTDIMGPDETGNVTIKGKDILSLADKEQAQAPKASKGYLSADLTDVATTFTLAPAGVGNASYTDTTSANPLTTDGAYYGRIGDEIVSFTRSADVFTIVRALKGTTASDASSNDLFQEVLVYEGQSIDTVLGDLLDNYTTISGSFLDTATWVTEITTWLNSTSIDTVIPTPSPVADLVGDLSVLGVSIWWDAQDQLVKMKSNRPPFRDPIYYLSDTSNLKSLKQEDRDEDRRTQVYYYSLQNDVTKDPKDKGGYDRLLVTVDSDAETANYYNDSKTREVFCRWLNQGDEISVDIFSKRLLLRFNTAPKKYTMRLDLNQSINKLVWLTPGTGLVSDIQLTDVLEVTSRVVTGATGESIPTLMQVIGIRETIPGHEVEITAQDFDFSGRYGYITPNAYPVYGSATDTQKSAGCWISLDTGFFANGDQAYELI